MITKLKKLVQELSSKKEFTKHHLYAQIIKNERSKRKLTLAEMAKGICSISYLCKFEKNDIIADESYIRAIFDRVDIDFNLVGRNILKNGIENVIKAYLANDNDAIELLYNSIDDTIFNSQNYLIKCFYYLVKNKYLEFNENIKALDNIKETLLIDEIGVLMFLVVEYYINTEQYFDANKILRDIIPLKYNIEELIWLIDEQYFNVGFYLKDYQQMYYYYNKILSVNNLAYPYLRKINARAKYLYAESCSNFQRSYLEFQQINFKNIPSQYHREIDYWKIASYIQGGMYLKAYDEIYDNDLYFESRFVALLLLSAYYIGDDNYIDPAYNIANHFEIVANEQQHNLFIKFMLLYLKGKYNHEYVEYLKEKIIPYKTKYKHFIYNDFYLEKYVYFLKKGSKYKEALLCVSENLTK